MKAAKAESAREKLLRAGTEMIRREGYAATSVDSICEAAGVTKGAFFHHFESKDALAEACLDQWNCQGAAMDAGSPHHAVSDPVEKVAAYMDYYLGIFSNRKLVKSCLAGTVAQEVSDSNASLRKAANTCFASAERRLAELLDDAGKARRKKVDAPSLARLWIAALQGSLILAKASGDDGVIPASLAHVRDYIMTMLAAGKRRS